MPPKIKTSKQQIADTAFELVQKEGICSLSAKNLAKKLGCSTQPLFWWYENMDEIKDVTLKRAYTLFTDYLSEKIDGVNAYKAIGINYIRFASEQKELFKALFMSGNKREDTLSVIYGIPFILEALNAQTSLDEKDAKTVLKEMWLFAHGIATMVATDTAKFDRNDIDSMLTDTFKGLILYYDNKK